MIFIPLFCAVVLLLILQGWRRHRFLSRWNSFPGPKAISSLPLLGHSYMLGSAPIPVLKELLKKYGDVVRFDLGPTPTVLIGSYDMLMDLFKREAFSYRPDNPGSAATRDYDQEGRVCGVGFSEGEVNVEMRKHFKKFMSELGMVKGGNTVMEGVITRRTKMIIDHFSNQIRGQEDAKTGRLKISGAFMNFIGSLVWELATGKDLKDCDGLTKAMLKFQYALDPSSLYNTVTNNSTFFLKLASFMGLETCANSLEPLKAFLRPEIESSAADCDGFIVDKYLAAAEEADTSGNVDALLAGLRGRKNILGSLLDLFIGGTDTVSTFMEWAVYCLVSYPDVQAKAAEQIADKVGTRTISLQDESQLPYVSALIQEITRHIPMVNFTIPHSNNREVVVGDYTFPKGTQIAPVTSVINMCPKTFAPDPEVFRPERFINKEGKYQGTDRVMLFGAGKRRCPGDILAKAEMFFILTSLLQNFKFRAVPGFQPRFDNPKPGIIFYPPDFEAIMETR